MITSKIVKIVTLAMTLVLFGALVIPIAVAETKVDLPSSPPPMGILMVNNMKLSNHLLFINEVPLLGTAVNELVDRLSKNAKTDRDSIYIDIYTNPFGMVYQPKYGVYGYSTPINYVEVDYYYVK